MASDDSENLVSGPSAIITPQDIAGMDVITNLKLSRDGSRVVYVVGPAYKSGDNKTAALWIADTSTEKSAFQLTSGNHRDYSPVFHPSSAEQIYFLSDRDETGGSAHLFRLSVKGSIPDAEKTIFSVVELGDRQGVSSYSISPDGKFLAFVLETKALKKGEKEVIKVWRETKFYNTLMLVDLQESSKSSRELVSENAHVVSFTWSPDSTSIAYRLLDHADMEAKDGLLPANEKIMSIFSNESRDAFQYARPPTSDTVWKERGDFVFLQKRQPLELSSVNTLWSWAQSLEKLSPPDAKSLGYGETNDLNRIIDLQQKSQYVVEVAENLITKFDIWDEANRFAFTAFQTEVNYATHDWDVIVTENRQYVLVALKSSGVSGELPNIWSGTTEFGKKGGLTKRLSSHNSWFASKIAPEAKPFYWKGTDGVNLEGVISFPKGVKLKNLPMVIVAHGGPAMRDTLSLELGFSRWRPFLASCGYLVFSPNYRGGVGRGNSFAMAANGVGNIEWLDIEAMIEEGISQGIVDPQRVGIGGYSQGGFLAALGVTRPNNRFKVGVIGAGVTDWGMLAATSDIPDIETTLGGGAPWRSGEPVYLKGSPIKDVKNVTAPVLLVHGKDDVRVPVTQAISFVRGVEREAKPAVVPQLVIYPREDHFFEERLNCEDILRRVLEHFQKCIGDVVRSMLVRGGLRSWNAFWQCDRRKLFISHYLSSDQKPLVENVDNKAYSNTLLLPKTSFPLRPDLKEIEKTYGKLTCESLYQWQSKKADGPVFVLHDGPPYANGDLHMGHALNKIIKDIINRFHLLQGRKVHYVPGWDCHGLPIENKAMKEMKKSHLDTHPSVIRKGAEATALREIDSQREQFRTLAIMADWYSKENTYRTLDRKYEIRQLRVFQKMVEKGLIYRQHRPVHYSPSSHSALAEAELEYKDDHVSHSVYVTLDVDLDSGMALINDELLRVLPEGEKVQLLVWTTTPWTLTANMGIAVHEELTYSLVRRTDAEEGSQIVIVAQERLDSLSEVLGPLAVLGNISGRNLVGLSYKSIFPSSTQSLKIIHAPHVTALSGTGLVHCAPAHGVEDYDVFRLLNLLSPATSTSASSNIVCHVDDKGQFSPDVADVVGQEHAQKLVGKPVLGDGNKEMVMLLKELGRVLKVQRIKHRYPYDWKTNEPIIVTATSQWFANLDHIKEDALRALKKVAFFPETSRNRLESFVRSRSEWCISRQRAWGVPIPALHHISSGRVVLDSQTLDWIIRKLEDESLDWWKSPIEHFVPPWLIEGEHDRGRLVSEVWEKGRDTMDVWFDSGTSWAMLAEMDVGRGSPAWEGGPQREVDADLCLEGSDQHRGWFQSQLLTAVGSRDAKEPPVPPYAALITHGMVLDEKGKKMSKSLGNIISPMSIIRGSLQDKKQPAYGVDVLRLWAATVDFWRDMSIGPTVIAQAVESLRKLRNSARFCLGNMGSREAMEQLERVGKEDMNILDRYVMHELYTLEETALEGYRTYNFPKVISALNNFANITLSSLYFDVTKDCLYANSIQSRERRAVVTVLELVLGTMTKVLAPVLPYLAEEIHAAWKVDGKSIFMTPWSPLSEWWKDDQAASEMAQLLAVRDTVLSLLEKARRDKNLKSSLEAEVELVYPNGNEKNELLNLLLREENYLKTLLIVSEASVKNEGMKHSELPEWIYSSTDKHSLNTDSFLSIHVRPASLNKCPRCWTFTREPSRDLCTRCDKVVRIDQCLA